MPLEPQACASVAQNCAIASRTVEKIVLPTVDDGQRALAGGSGDLLEYQGTAFVMVDPNDDATKVKIRGGMIKPRAVRGGLTDPIWEYSHSVGQSITGGFVYRGSSLPATFRGRYFFADYVQGRVWSMVLTINPTTQRKHHGVRSLFCADHRHTGEANRVTWTVWEWSRG